MRALTIHEVNEVQGGVRLLEAAVGFAALGGALALTPFAIAAGVAIGGAAILEGMDVAGM